MAVVAISDSILTDIADAIRSKNGQETLYKPSDMPDAIEAISGGGITPTGTKEITSNGTGIDVASYAYADVAVSNSYSAGDEGKVVSNGALVAQTSDTVTSNDTYDTTLINSLTVNVSGGGGVSDFELIDTLTVSDVRSYQIDIDSNWLSDYVCVLIVPDLTISASDWIYVANDGTTGGNYTDKVTKFGNDYTMILSGNSSFKRYTWWKNSNSSNSMLNLAITDYLYVYAYTPSSKMNGTIKVYGMRR